MAWGRTAVWLEGTLSLTLNVFFSRVPLRLFHNKPGSRMPLWGIIFCLALPMRKGGSRKWSRPVPWALTWSCWLVETSLRLERRWEAVKKLGLSATRQNYISEASETNVKTTCMVYSSVWSFKPNIFLCCFWLLLPLPLVRASTSQEVRSNVLAWPGQLTVRLIFIYWTTPCLQWILM